MDTIDPNQKVADLLAQHPQSYQVFRRYACPDMRDEFFSYMARIQAGLKTGSSW